MSRSSSDALIHAAFVFQLFAVLLAYSCSLVAAAKTLVPQGSLLFSFIGLCSGLFLALCHCICVCMQDLLFMVACISCVAQKGCGFRPLHYVSSVGSRSPPLLLTRPLRCAGVQE